jgi:alkylhydroperoxidase family enzyme
MSRYVQSIQTYLREIGEAEPKKLGVAAEPSALEILTGAQNSLERRLREDAKSTDRIIVVAVVLLCCLFFAGLGLVFYYRDSPGHVAAMFGGGSFLSLLGIVGWLRKLWFDKRTMDLLLVLVQSMSPADAAKVLATFYFGALSPKTT